MLPQLNKAFVLSPKFQARTNLAIPSAQQFELPEKVLQFGSGVLLRAFADFFIETANRNGRYNGRVIVVQSTPKGKSDALKLQDGLYTVCEQGLENGEAIERFSIISAVSRAISAQSDWAEVLACARIPTLELIISNTTEVGLVFDEKDSATANPPSSFPAKLVRFLYERFLLMPEKGFVIVPTELVENNADKLRDYVQRHAEKAKFGKAFEDWVRQQNRFCNSLVDRIVPGKPNSSRLEQLQARLGYTDDLLICAELYSLWAIEGDEDVAKVLGFKESNPSVIVSKNITPYRERKLRILNRSHTISVATALLSGKSTVLEMMSDSLTGRFVEAVVNEEIVPSLDIDGTSEFALDVLNRFRNPFLDHKLQDITFQYTLKLKTRVLPIIRKYHEKHHRLPRYILFGFAAYLMREAKERALNDEFSGVLLELWKHVSDLNPENLMQFVTKVSESHDIWGMNLNGIPEFTAEVAFYLNAIIQEG